MRTGTDGGSHGESALWLEKADFLAPIISEQSDPPYPLVWDALSLPLAVIPFTFRWQAGRAIQGGMSLSAAGVLIEHRTGQVGVI